MSAVDSATLAEVILGAGLLNFAVEVAKRLMGRKRDQVDVAGRAQGIALQIMEELRNETTAARREVAELRRTVSELDAELSQWVAWSRMAKREFDNRGIVVAPFPTRRFDVNGTSG